MRNPLRFFPSASAITALLVLGLHAFGQSPAVPQVKISDIPPQTQQGQGPGKYVPPVPAKADLPALWLIGDSTVRNGSKGDNGPEGQWGWGAPIVAYFDLAKINVVNRALGGTSSRSFYNKNWKDLKPLIKKGDIVIMNFGHNDPGNKADPADARASIKGIGDETREVATTQGAKETVHSFGWYLKQFVEETRSAGATPIICSLTPRKSWGDDGKLNHGGGYADWAEQTAKDTKTLFVPLNDIIAAKYSEFGKDKVEHFYVPSPKESLHTGWDGAAVNAECVISGLKALSDDPLKGYFSPRAEAVAAWTGKPAK